MEQMLLAEHLNFPDVLTFDVIRSFLLLTMTQRISVDFQYFRNPDSADDFYVFL